MAEAQALARALDQARYIRNHQSAVGVQLRDAKLGLKRGEGIIGNLGPRLAYGSEERAFAGIGQTGQADVGDELEFQAKPALLAGIAVGELAGRLVGAGAEMPVADAPLSAVGDGESVAGLG